MHLKTLKMTGFKSFKDPISLDFSKGISAIVGPNGSGKSNITDAIKWVLGEQSIKSLRGKKMEDVIFSGTERKPPSAYAEVVLVLDNRDGELLNYTDYIKIGRKLYRSGESEYTINKKSCKLRDIHDIFMDTGLGKNGYSLISQGGIEKIVGSSPNELRVIFEEAVGIVSYKNKKNDAEKKLEVTKDHMDRLDDILAEIKKQMGPLKKQADKASKYLMLYEELKGVDIVLFHEQINESIEKLLALKKDFSAQEKVCQANGRVISEIDKKYQERTIENRILLTTIEKTRNDLGALEDKLEYLQKEDFQGKSQREANRISQDRLKKETEEIERERLENQLKINDQLSQIEKGQEELDFLQDKLDDKKLALEKLLVEESIIRSHLKDDQEKILDEQKRREDLMERQITLRSEIQSISTRLKQLQEELKESRTQEAEGQKNYTSIKAELKSCLKNKNDLEGQQIKQRGQLLEMTREQQRVMERLQEEKNIIKVSQSKLDYLENIQASYQDYFPAIRKIMTSKKELGPAHEEVFGPVGELLTTNKRYLRAIDVALGGKSQNIVVSRVEIARQCINLLKKERLGRATFLPLDNLRTNPIDQVTRRKLKEIAGVEGVAADLVETKAKFLKCAQNLLGRTIVTDTFDSGKEVQGQLKGGFTIVSLDGEIFYPGGAILGGQNKTAKETPLSKKIDINRLLEKIDEKSKKQDQIMNQAKQLEKLIKKKEEKVINLEEEIKEADRLQWEKEAAIKNLILQISRIENQIARLVDEEKKLLARQKGLIDEQARIQGSDEGKKEAKGKSDKQDRLEALREIIEEKRLNIQGLEMSKTKIEAGLESGQNQYDFLAAHDQEKKKRLFEIDEKFKVYQNHNQTLDKGQEEFNQASSQLRENGDELKQKMKKDQQVYNNNYEELATLQEKIKEANHQLIINNDLKNRIIGEIKSRGISKDHLEKKLFEEYGMNYLMAEDAYYEFSQKERFKEGDYSPQRQDELKNKISQLGSINSDAIESYQALLLRHDYLDGQVKDLKLGKRELEKIIDELYEAISNQFKENFIKLQESLSRIFAILFEGGQAYLEFTNPQSVLEGGIELVAQPPGKKLRQLSLLSGGEKSMVAIALLFSFLEINPSPFCVIDEVDAALDEQNIFRYINYLKKMSEDNQFITITHRRRTLEVCDHLYGVSMSNDGISQLVSVRLLDYT